MTRSETIKTFFLKSVLPFGLHRMCLWIVPSNSSFGGGITLFALNFFL